MPIYEYQCQDCQHKVEVMQRMSDPLLTTCPACTKDSLKKLVSAVGFQLKGTGWYETDFKNKPKAKAEGETKSESSTAADGDASKSSDTTKTETKETKTEAKSESKTPAPASSD
jgi:putative FmdB family regulatory protein